MKTIFRVWVLQALYIPLIASQSNYDSDHLSQDSYDSQDGEQPYLNNREHQPINSHQYETHGDLQSGDPRHYQNLESGRYQPKAYSTQYFNQFYGTPHEPQISTRQPEYYSTPEHVQYNQPEDPSYHRPQEIAHHQPVEHHQDDSPQHDGSYHGSSRYHQPEPVKDDSNYKAKEPQYIPPPEHSPPSHPGLARTDPKLPLYFTMYEKRTIQDPVTKYGKGPWRYLTYGHGISYGSKGPGKVFEKGYGYIRALGRDHCKLPEHLCPPKDDEKPFEYEGRKEPYFGYRPH